MQLFFNFTRYNACDFIAHQKYKLTNSFFNAKTKRVYDLVCVRNTGGQLQTSINLKTAAEQKLTFSMFLTSNKETW